MNGKVTDLLNALAKLRRGPDFGALQRNDLWQGRYRSRKPFGSSFRPYNNLIEGHPVLGRATVRKQSHSDSDEPKATIRDSRALNDVEYVVRIGWLWLTQIAPDKIGNIGATPQYDVGKHQPSKRAKAEHVYGMTISNFCNRPRECRKIWYWRGVPNLRKIAMTQANRFANIRRYIPVNMRISIAKI